MKFVEHDNNAKEYLQVEDKCHEEKEYASKGVAGTALGLGIAGTALWLLNGGLGNSGLFGNRCMNGVAVGAAVGDAINRNDLQYVERKECADQVNTLNAMWELAYNGANTRFNDRQTLNSEFFGLYKGMRDGFDAINAKHNADAFGLYKYSRDSKDELMGAINALSTEVAVLKATRPYQDALIQCDIRRASEHAAFNLERRTCRMIEGQVVLPSTPTVTGYGSYNRCCPISTTTSSATAD